MPVKFMAWNVQNFGQNSAYSRLLKGIDSLMLAEFIAHVVDAHDVDVLGIMEVQQNPRAHLMSVVNALNRVTVQTDWCCDYVPGAVAAGVNEGEGNVRGPNDLAWAGDRGSPRREGYAFFWRAGNPDFTVLPAPVAPGAGALPVSHGPLTGAAFPVALPAPGHVVSLSMAERQVAHQAHAPYVTALQGYQAAAANATPWEASFYPGTSKYNPYSVFWEQVRRPAYIRIQLRNAAGPVGVPVTLMCYHAPSAALPSKVGTVTSGFARELYVDGVPGAYAANRVVFAGDFNVPVSAATAWAYQRIMAPNHATNTAGAACAALSTVAAPLSTTIQLNAFRRGTFTGPPLAGPNYATYCLSPIDNLFHRGLVTAAGPARVDLPLEVMNAGLLTGPALTLQCDSVLMAYADAVLAFRNVDANRGPTNARGTFVYPFLTDWQDFLVGMTVEEFPTMRSACEFIRMFISDHLPVVYSFNVA